MLHKNTFLGCLLALFALKGGAQELTRSVLAADGGSSSTSLVQLDWTLGEAVTETVYTDGHILTQGFHQSSIRIERKSDPSPQGMFDVNIYPNPTSALLNIKPEFKSDIAFEASVVDASGRILSSQRLSARDELSQLDVTRLPDGPYFIVIRPEVDDLSPITFQFTKAQ